MTENSTTVTFPIKEDWLPNVTLQVTNKTKNQSKRKINKKRRLK
jgi:hypothetical protein